MPAWSVLVDYAFLLQHFIWKDLFLHPMRLSLDLSCSRFNSGAQYRPSDFSTAVLPRRAEACWERGVIPTVDVDVWRWIQLWVPKRLWLLWFSETHGTVYNAVWDLETMESSSSWHSRDLVLREYQVHCLAVRTVIFIQTVSQCVHLSYFPVFNVNRSLVRSFQTASQALVLLFPSYR